jgi:hypothetical protein
MIEAQSKDPFAASMSTYLSLGEQMEWKDNETELRNQIAHDAPDFEFTQGLLFRRIGLPDASAPKA